MDMNELRMLARAKLPFMPESPPETQTGAFALAVRARLVSDNIIGLDGHLGAVGAKLMLALNEFLRAPRHVHAGGVIYSVSEKSVSPALFTNPLTGEVQIVMTSPREVPDALMKAYSLSDKLGKPGKPAGAPARRFLSDAEMAGLSVRERDSGLFVDVQTRAGHKTELFFFAEGDSLFVADSLNLFVQGISPAIALAILGEIMVLQVRSPQVQRGLANGNGDGD